MPPSYYLGVLLISAPYSEVQALPAALETLQINTDANVEFRPAGRKDRLLQPTPDGSSMCCVKFSIYTTYLQHVRVKF